MDPPHRPPHRTHPGQIAGIASGVLLAALLVVGFIILCLRLFFRKGSRQVSRSTMRSYSLPIRDHGIDSGLDSSSDLRPQHQLLHLDLGVFGNFWSWGQSNEPPPMSPHDRITRFTYKDLQKATNEFNIIIGQGAFGPVYKAFLPNMSVVAVKVLGTCSKQGEKEFQNEVLLLGRLHHKNLLNLVGYCSEGGHRLLAYEFMSNGNLAARLHDEQYQPLSWDQRISIAQDVARGIEYLHDGAVPPVIHRDIKASNILLDSCMTARVADFGLSKEAEQGMPASGIRGTYGYIDPEYITTSNLSYKSDVYSFGVLLFELITGQSPQEGLMESIELLLPAANEGGEVWLQILDPRLKGSCNLGELGEMALIAAKCVEKEARHRPKMQEIVQALSRFRLRGQDTSLDLGSH